MSLLYYPVLSDEANGRRVSSSQPPPFVAASRHRPHDDKNEQWQHLYVLPVLLLEFLALALTRAVMPALLLHKFRDHVYIVMGMAEFVRGLLAFFACPLFGKVSDIIGRRICLFVTVMGTCAPVCSLALFSWGPTLSNNNVAQQSYNTSSIDAMLEAEDADGTFMLPMDESTISMGEIHPYAITVFVVLFSLSGIFASTFTLVFAYISDTVRNQDERVSAYGLALATFGLSFTIGPMAGGYLAQSNRQYVFILSFILTVVDLLYIYFILPESKELKYSIPNSVSSSASLVSEHQVSWNPITSLQIILFDDFLYKVGQVAFLYYTGLWALISTLSVYAVKHFHLSPERLGELMSVLGLCTMVAEAVLVRIAVPLLGEKTSIKVGLVSFGLQCIVLGFAYEGWHLFVCAGFSLAGNLVYPSLSSLVSGSVEPEAVGEALGAINGIKALTEGFGPLLFGGLMTISEDSSLPGWPYLLVSVLVGAAYMSADSLPDPEAEDFIHELERKKRRRRRPTRGLGGLAMRAFGPAENNEEEDEEESLLSEIESEDGEEMSEVAVKSHATGEDLSRLPATFATLSTQFKSVGR
ncbi:hypothetical protein MPSEU_000147400 [Mayamaea pseudoterrestris]|nr:hypothetical protein MPSEU_000147400 [Mayamaea pseudoterrestris]